MPLEEAFPKPQGGVNICGWFFVHFPVQHFILPLLGKGVLGLEDKQDAELSVPIV